MFLGHYGLAFAAKRAAPRTSLGALTFAAEFLDELWPILLLLGVEQVRIAPWLVRRDSSIFPAQRHALSTTPLDFAYYPFSHSLLMAIVWGALIGGLYFALRGYGRGAWVMWALVASHWLLDLPMHRGDLPLWLGESSPKFGWGLWNSLALTYIIEFTIFLAGISVYVRATRPRDQIGRWGFWAYCLVLAAIYMASNGPPPPSVNALAWTTMGVWVFVPWAWWVDKHRYYIGRIPIPIER
jgi:hypothetical protein